MLPVSDLYMIGLAKRDITPQPRGEAMLGFGDPNHRANSVALPLNVRAVVLIAENGKRTALACLEICFVTQALRDEVLLRLREKDPSWTEDEIILSGTHTHCAPGGHAHDILYSISSFGWYPHVLEKYAQGTVDAILEATKSARPGRIRYAEGEFEKATPVAFNRSIQAWNRNPDVTKFTYQHRDQAVDRTMRLFRFEDANGNFIGCLNEFAVHCTSVHRDHNVIHSDNKGVAATEMENEVGGICVFVNGAAGDVSPNFQYFKGLFECRGVDRDDLVSAKTNGRFQKDLAKKLNEVASTRATLPSTVRTALEYNDMSKVHVDPHDVGGRTDCHTGPAAIGARALLGTEEGRPTPFLIYCLVHLVSRFADLVALLTRKDVYFYGRDPVHGPKISCLQTGKSEVFRTSDIGRFIVPDFVDPMVGQLKTWGRRQLTKLRPLTPQIVPVQIVQVGTFALLAIPGELTTTSGRRLKKSILQDLAGTGIDNAMIVGYANSYSGYITTPEEYQVQLYEGASTHFGQWTQPAYQTVFRKLTAHWRGTVTQISTLRPPRPTPEELQGLRAADPIINVAATIASI